MNSRYTLLFLVLTQFYGAQSTDEKYIARFAEIAVNEMKIYKIPASITLAQGLLETADGQSELAQNANNHFGIKCKKEWTGDTYRYTDDAYMECFRKYNSPEESYRDHSKFLAERPYYKALFNLDMRDYKAWAYGLKKAGYATNPKYAPLLIHKIEKYRLYEFDRIEPEEVTAKLIQLYPALESELFASHTVKEDPIEIMEEKLEPIVQDYPEVKEVEDKILHAPESRVHPSERIEKHKNKNLNYVKIQKGETLQQLSSLYGISVKDLQNYNDIENQNLIGVGDYLFLQQKKNKGKSKTYTVVKGDDLRSVAQKEGIRLKSLLKRNRLNEWDTIEVGQILYLKGKKKK